MEIKKEYIDEAEKILLPPECHFDDERRHFICNLSSLDLVAVPGSGKTTALQAKLYCLSKSLPFETGAGVLVLSHTNAAVDEVKNKLAFTSPQLFSYPSAVITVQEFIDRFLALPFYSNAYKVPVTAIDGARYIEAIERYMNHLDRRDYARMIWDLSRPDSNPFYKARFFYDYFQHKTILTGSVSYSELSVPLPHNWTKSVEEKKDHIKAVIYDMKASILKDGILTYDDCYYLASVYMAKHPEIKSFLRTRFPFVFVDETQDLKQYQLDIISQVFDDSSVTLQRIGDHNQAIYSNGNEGDCEWQPKTPMTLKNSLRLNQVVANKVNPFMLNRKAFEGKEDFFVNGAQPNPLNIKPFLVLYDSNSPESLKASFLKLIRLYRLSNHSDAKYGFHIIGWNASYSNTSNPGENRKPRLEDLFPEYRHMSASRMNARVSLSDYLNSVTSDYSSKEIKDLVLSAVCRAVSQTGARVRVITPRGEMARHYSPSSYLAKAKEEENAGEALDTVLYQVLYYLQKENKAQAYEIIKHYISGPALELLGVKSNALLQSFLGVDFQENNRVGDRVELVKDLDVPIEISTVHSAKGQTHCATMYVETSFSNRFESEWLITTKKATKTLPERLNESPFFGDSITPETEGARKAMKMLYVGFSRPRQLLCYASWKSLWDEEKLAKMRNCGWEIMDASDNSFTLL